MGISVGTRLGPYEIVGALGAGAMGEVYRARDARLGRDVAIKVIPDALAFDAARLARFTREAQILASLNHANVATVYGLEYESENGRQALVLELVEGMTLAEHLARRSPSIDEALAIARQIAEGLEAAHERGIVHRDLKPANVMITPGGNVKVLDFGIARADQSSAGTDAPTVLGTMPGAIMGTPQYMAPEQALGQPADSSADVWAFGCVLYEMLTGQQAFAGRTAGEVVANVLKAELDWDRLPAATPGGIRRLLRRSLEKKPSQRLRDIRSARLEIDDALAGGPAAGGDDGFVSSRRKERLVWASGLIVMALAAAMLGVRALRPPALPPEARLDITTPPSRSAGLALSPDGRQVVFNAVADGQSQLWLRSLDSVVARPLPGTADGIFPFWSADGRSIAFFAGTRLMRVDIDGGSATTLRIAELPMGGAWNADDVLLLANRPGLPLFRVTASGGAPIEVTGFESGHDGYSSPHFLPDGVHFLFFARGRPDVRGVHLGSLDGLGTRRLFDADTPAVYASTGHLLFVRDGTLYAQRFDTGLLELAGQPFAVAEGLNAGTELAASAAGPIAYRTPPPDSGQRQLVWVDRSGAELERAVYPDVAALGPALSPDGRYVGVFRVQGDNMDLWSYDRLRRLWDRMTVGAYHEIYPLWFAGDARIVFASNRNGRLDLYSKMLSAPAGEGEELLLSTPEAKWPMDLRRDGQYLLYTSLSAETHADIWVLPLEGEHTPQEVIRTEFYEQLPQFSPDGEWIAYQSDRTGRFEVYLRKFPGGGTDIRVSTEGGGQARWSPDGGELYYVGTDDWLMAVPIRPDSAGTLEPGTPERLFATNVGSAAPNTNRHQYVVAPDGRSFLLNSVAGDASVSPITVILNWKPQSAR